LPVVKFADYILNEIDFVKFFLKINADNINKIEIKINQYNLNALNIEKEKHRVLGFQDKKEKKWYKAKYLNSGQEQPIKVKLHGRGLTFIEKNTYSLKVKHKSEGPYRDLMKNYDLLSMHGDNYLPNISLNKVAKRIGLFTPEQKVVNLEINNINYGAYLLEYHLNAHAMEKNFKIPNYSIIKNVSSYQRKFNGDLSDKELYSEFYEVDGNSQDLNQIALSVFDLFLEGIQNNDLNQVIKYIDLDYYAKYLALLNIYNHTEGGLDLTYIYNHDNGKIYLYFRKENPTVNMIYDFSSTGFFNKLLFENNKSEMLKVFKVLLNSKEFVALRDKHLFNIIKDKKNILNLIDKIFFENKKMIIHSNLPRSQNNYLKKKTKKNIIHNLKIAEKYLKYAKIYISKIGDNRLSILPDIFVDHELTGYYNIKDELKNFSTPIILKGQQNLLSNTFNGKDVFNFKVVDNIDVNQIKGLQIKNSIYKNLIKETDIYFNEMKKLSFVEAQRYEQILKKNYFKYSKFDDDVIIHKGYYNLKNNLILPNTKNLKIEEGTKIVLHKDVNILVQGNFEAIGSSKDKIILSSLNPRRKSDSFGSVIVLGDKNKSRVRLEYFEVSGGNQANINGINSTGQIMLSDVSDILIYKSKFTNSYSDDGINIKNSNVKILDSYFINNNFDQLDCDICDGEIINNYFGIKNIINKNLQNEGGDGLDLSFSKMNIEGNIFEKNLDKGLSVGEKTDAIINNNIFLKNQTGVAIKDESNVCMEKNIFTDNVKNVDLYIKKKFYGSPKIVCKNILVH
jgi:hypothetical protein